MIDCRLLRLCLWFTLTTAFLANVGTGVALWAQNATVQDRSADEYDSAGGNAVIDRVAELDLKIAAQVDRQQTLQAEIIEARKQATDLDRHWQGLAGAVDEIRAEQQALKTQLQEQREAKTSAAEKHEASVKAVEAARQALEEARRRLVKAEQEAEAAQQEADTAAMAIAETEKQLVALAPQADERMPAVERARQESQKFHQSIDAMESQAEKLAQRQNELRRQIETLLRDAGQWVSFSDQIAPIVHQRCVACHNARNPQGRYNMVTYAAMLAESESGVPIEPGDAENSLLFHAVMDGWMPFETDPLGEDEVRLIRRWIDLGARLDVAADAETPLIRIMPPVVQPDPPEQYRVPIPVTAVAIDPEGRWVASSGYHEVLLWSLKSGKRVRRITNVAERVNGLAFHPDGKRLAVAAGTPGRLGEIKVFDAERGELLEQRLVSDDSFFEVAYSPDGSRLAACGADGTIAIFDVDDPLADPRLIDDHADWVNSIAWSSDGRWLVSASRDKTAKVFDADSGRLKVTFSGHDQNVTAASFLHDNERVISGGEDQKLRIWKIDDGKQQRDLSGFGGGIRGIRVLADSRVLSISTDSELRVHQIDDGKKLQAFRAPANWLCTLAAGDDGTVVMFGDQAGQLHRASLKGEGEVELSWDAVP